MKLIFWYIFRALAWFSLWNIIDFIEFLKSMLCRFKRGSQRAGPSDQPSASGLFLAQSLIGWPLHGQRDWAFTPSGGGDMEIQKTYLKYNLVTSSYAYVTIILFIVV